MAKLTLDFEPEFDFLLIGISCHLKDYRFVWTINQHMDFQLKREEDLSMIVDKSKSKSLFSIFSFEDEENHIHYTLISNRGDAGVLIPELKQVDYFLQIRGPVEEDKLQEEVEKLKKMPNVLTAFSIEPTTLKSGSILLI